MADNSEFQILIVDDEPDITEMLADEFELSGYKVQTANGGHEAFKILMESGNIDVVISDVRMPDGDGVELLNSINEATGIKRPVIFFITGQADITRDQAIEQGVKEFFHKPFDLRGLVSAVEGAIHG